MKKILTMLMALALITSVFTACDNSSKTQSQTSSKAESQVESGTDKYGPVTVENFNTSYVLEKMPTNITCLNLNTAEMIVALGSVDSLANIITGNYCIEDVSPEYLTELKKVTIAESISKGIPTLEAMIDLEPDMVVANSYYFNVPAFGTMEDYNSLGINFYIPEGSYVPNCTIEQTYKDIENLGEIFNQKENANALIDDMKNTIDAVSEKIKDQEAVKIAYIDSITEDGKYFVVGGAGLTNNLITLAGGENVFANIEAQFSPVSLEDLIASNPDVIIFSDYTSQKNNGQGKIDRVKNSGELDSVNAVINDRFSFIPLYNTFPGLKNDEAVEAIAKALYPDLF